MTEATFNFLVDTLVEEVRMHPYRDELLELVEEQLADDSDFIPHTYEEIMSWKVGGWELPSSVCCVIRVTDVNTKKVKEHVYSKRSAAQAKVDQLINMPGIEFTVADHQAIHHLSPATDND